MNPHPPKMNKIDSAARYIYFYRVVTTQIFMSMKSLACSMILHASLGCFTYEYQTLQLCKDNLKINLFSWLRSIVPSVVPPRWTMASRPNQLVSMVLCWLGKELWLTLSSTSSIQMVFLTLYLHIDYQNAEIAIEMFVKPLLYCTHFP